jgi:Ca2+-binding EF-hand superfamily protein
MVDRLFDENDNDGDGKLSRDEMPKRAERLFDRADTNEDGFVDRSELMTTLQNRR